MDDQARLREILERNAGKIRSEPSLARHTGRTTVRLRPGLECEVQDGAWRLTVGMGEQTGGNNAGPSPGTLGRGALGSCLAIGYSMWAARLGVPLRSLEVEVAADYDSRGELGVSEDVNPGYQQVRYTVTVDSPEPREAVLRMLDTADRFSPYRDIFTRPNDVQRLVRFVGQGD